MSREAHTVEDFGQPEYLDGAMMRFALSDEQGRRTAYVATKANATLYAAAPALLEDAKRRVKDCGECEGAGRVRRPHGFFMVTRDCPVCAPTRAAIQSATGEG